MKRLTYLIVLVVFSCSFFFNTVVANPLIVDTDMAYDDWLSIAYLVGHQIPIAAILVDNNGASSCEPPYYYGANNAAKLLALNSKKYQQTIISCGVSKSRHGAKPSLEFRHEMDTLLGIPLTAQTGRINVHDSAENILYQHLIHQKKTDLIMLGTSTILATVITEHPEVILRIGKVYMMGGAIYVNGNALDKLPSQSEWNIYLDPDSFQVILNAKLDLTLFPLDVTNSVPIISWDVLYALQNSNNPVANFYQNVYNKLLEMQHIQNNADFFWDPITTVSYIHPHIVLNAYKLKLCVNKSLKNPGEIGALTICKQGMLVTVVFNVNVTQFKTYLYTQNVSIKDIANSSQ